MIDPIAIVRLAGAAAAGAALLACAACGGSSDAAPPPVRPVRTITIERPAVAADVTFTGHVEAQDRAALSFRVGGRLSERLVGVGATVKDGQVLARLDPENELNELRSAQAALTEAEGVLRQAENHYQRQSHLLQRGVTTRADFEDSEQARIAARAQVEAAEAHVNTAETVVGFTVLRADAPGVVTAVGAEPGEVVAAGRMVVQLVRREGREAVFEVPADFLRTAPSGATVVVALSSDPNVTAKGRVREVSPQADPITRTFRVRVGLSDPPAAMRLGTAVTGRIPGEQLSALAVPASALVQRDDGTGVWLVDPASRTVSLRKLDVISVDPATAFVTAGLATGDIVVTAGANLLRDGQTVRLVGTEQR